MLKTLQLFTGISEFSWILRALVASSNSRWCYFFLFLFDCWYFQVCQSHSSSGSFGSHQSSGFLSLKSQEQLSWDRYLLCMLLTLWPSLDDVKKLNKTSLWALINFSTKNQLFNLKSTENQPSTKFQTIFQHWYFKLKHGWFLVELWLRSWFLGDHCYKINNFSTKYQRWGWLRNVEAKLICAHWDLALGCNHRS